MAWVSFMFGAAVALVLAVTGYIAFDMPLWLVAVLYPFAGCLAALPLLAFLAARSAKTKSAQKAAEAEKPHPAEAG